MRKLQSIRIFLIYYKNNKEWTLQLKYDIIPLKKGGNHA